MILALCILLALSWLPNTSTRENISAVQIVKPSGSNSLQYVKNNKLEEILNSEGIKDRYVVVVSIVGVLQSGKSLMLNYFLNYLRATYQISNPFTYKNYDTDWINMNAIDGFYTTPNRSGTTKGIWAWPEVFTHDNITNGNKVAIIIIDTEGLFHIDKDLQYNTMIFALSTMFSSMQGYSVFKGVYADTMQFLDIFSTYTVYGSRLMARNRTKSTKVPFQNFYFIIQDSDNPDESEKIILKHIFPDVGSTDQNREMKTRIRTVFKNIRAFQIPHVGDKSIATQIDQRFKAKVAAMVTEILAPANIVIKEISGERVKAKDLAHFLESFTEIMKNNVTITTTLVEVLANASNWLVYHNYLQHYDDLMQANLSAIRNGPKSYLEHHALHQLHLRNKDTSMYQFKDHIKLGGYRLATPFEKQLSDKIDEHFTYFRESNEQRRLEYLNEQKAAQSTYNKIVLIFYCIVVALAILGIKTLCNTCCRCSAPS